MSLRFENLKGEAVRKNTLCQETVSNGLNEYIKDGILKAERLKQEGGGVK